MEVSSPISLRIELVRKTALYARCGVPEYWIADPERRRLVINILQDKQYVPIEPDATVGSPRRHSRTARRSL